MDIETLSPEEEAILDAIIQQRLSNYGDIFELSFSDLQNYLNNTGVSTKYLITPEKQLEIIQKLSRSRIIDMDWIVNAEFIENYRSISCPNYQPKELKEKLYWYNQTEWAYKSVQLDGRISIEKACATNKGKNFIRMTIDDIKKIETHYKRIHRVKLTLNKDRLCLCIKINNQSLQSLQPLKDGKTPFKILKYAFDNRNRTITRKELSKEANIDIGNRYLRTQVFKDNSTVQALIPKFLDITTDTITFNTKPVKLNLSELNTLKAGLNI